MMKEICRPALCLLLCLVWDDSEVSWNFARPFVHGEYVFMGGGGGTAVSVTRMGGK